MTLFNGMKVKIPIIIKIHNDSSNMEMPLKSTSQIIFLWLTTKKLTKFDFI